MPLCKGERSTFFFLGKKKVRRFPFPKGFLQNFVNGIWRACAYVPWALF
jgi:hypothetical protein